MPTLAAFAFRHNMGQPYVYPDNDLRYPGNFLSMLYKMTELKYEPDPRLERALDILFILHADHEQNCSTERGARGRLLAGRPVLGGRRRRRRALRPAARRRQRGRCCGCCAGSRRKENIPDFIEGVKDGKERLMGFGHRVYKNYDPRAKIIKKAADDVFEVTGTNPLLDIALELEKIALEDDYFVKRKLYPNVDFYSGLIYEALGMPVEHVPGAVRDPAHERLDRPVARDDRRQGAEDRAPAPDLHGRARRATTCRSTSAPERRSSRVLEAPARGGHRSRVAAPDVEGVARQLAQGPAASTSRCPAGRRSLRRSRMRAGWCMPSTCAGADALAAALAAAAGTSSSTSGDGPAATARAQGAGARAAGRPAPAVRRRRPPRRARATLSGGRQGLRARGRPSRRTRRALRRGGRRELAAARGAAHRRHGRRRLLLAQQAITDHVAAGLEPAELGARVLGDARRDARLDLRRAVAARRGRRRAALRARAGTRPARRPRAVAFAERLAGR